MSVESKLRGLRQILQFDNRLHLLLQRLFFRGDVLAVYRKGPLEILVDQGGGDANGAPEVLTHPMYADHLAYLVTAHPARVLDVGANNGGFPLFLALHGVRFERLVSVELNPRTCTRLRFNLERNIPGDVRVVNAALAGTARTFELALGAGSVADSLYARSDNASGAATVVAGRTFDELFDAHFAGQDVDICKIDVEQAEYEVMANPGHDRLRRCRLLVMEIHAVPGRSPSEVIDPILALGFELLPQGRDTSVFVFRNRIAAASA
ncbi:MAG: FkbM family methyltransferase [Vicinamibacterales bacterium]